MKLSSRTTYGLRAALALAANYSDEPLSVSRLASENQIPKSYLEQILNRLRRKNLVVAVRGAKGGYRLAKDPQTITVGDIVRAVEDTLGPMLCSFPELQSALCRQQGDCASRTLCSEVEANLLHSLDSTNLFDLAQRPKAEAGSSSVICLDWPQ